MTPHPKIIFFDIDETLYINRGKKYVPESAKTALKLLKQKGIITAIATGRTIPIIPPKIVELIEECGIDMIVSLNGQYVEYQGKALAAFPLDNALVAHVSGCLTAHGIAHILAAREGLFAIAENHYLHDALNALGIRYQSDPAACGKCLRSTPPHKMPKLPRYCRPRCKPFAGTPAAWIFWTQQAQKRGASPPCWINWTSALPIAWRLAMG